MVPWTEPITLPLRRITYLSGAGPVAGPDQWNATELVVEGPATSPAGRNSGGLAHRAQVTRPAVKPSTAAITTTGRTHLRRPRRAAAAAVTGEGPAGCGGVGVGGANPDKSVVATPPSATFAVQPV